MTPNPHTYNARALAYVMDQKTCVLEGLQPLWLEAVMIEAAAVKAGQPSDAFRNFADNFTTMLANLIVNTAVNTANNTPRFESHTATYLEIIMSKSLSMCEAHRQGHTKVATIVAHDITTGKRVDWDFREHLKGTPS